MRFRLDQLIPLATDVMGLGGAAESFLAKFGIINSVSIHKDVRDECWKRLAPGQLTTRQRHVI